MRLGARAVFSFDPRPDAQSSAHITMQWQRRLEAQGLLIPKCIHQHRGGVHLLVPDELRDVRAVPEGRLKVAQGASPGTAGHPKTKSPGGATERTTTLLHPGSGGRAKCWPLSCFIDVARRLRESDEDVCFIVGPVEAERWSSHELDAIRNEFPLIESPSPNDLLHLLVSARVLIGNDAGPAHVAALVGTPTLTIFGATSPIVWRPLGPHARYIKGNPESNPEDWRIDPARVAAMATSTRT
jgi:ADP-heptose:LPS heptosyltransferase